MESTQALDCCCDILELITVTLFPPGAQKSDDPSGALRRLVSRMVVGPDGDFPVLEFRLPE